MAWTIEFDAVAAKQLARLDKHAARRIVAYLRHIADSDDPRTRGKGLTGRLAGLWRYRVGDYRIIVDICDSVTVVLAVEISHRSRTYRQK